MGARLQSLIGSQRQLLRDVSHELRSPLARLRIALALAERASPEERQKLWPRLTRECDRLEALISEILVLARVDADNASAEEVDLNALLATLQRDAQMASPEQSVRLEAEAQLNLQRLADHDRTRRGQPAAQCPALQSGERATDRNAGIASGRSDRGERARSWARR